MFMLVSSYAPDGLDQTVHCSWILKQVLVQRARGDTGLQRDRTREARRHGIDAYTSAAPFGGERLRDLDDAGFRRGIGVDRAGGHARNGGDIDDGAMPPPCHPHADTAGDEERAAQVDIDLAVPLIHPHPLDRMHLAEYAGGVDEAGNGTVRGFDIGDAAHDGTFAGDVERRRPQDRLRSGERLRCDVDDHHTLPLPGQKRRGRGANAAAAAGDQNDTLSGHDRCRYRVN